MIAVIFEVVPSKGKQSAYLDIATELRPILDEIDGFISVERFESLTTPGKILSLSFFRDETALEAWRTEDKHRAAQRAGRTELFDDYRLRVASVIRDYGKHNRDQAPTNSKVWHDGNSQESSGLEAGDIGNTSRNSPACPPPPSIEIG